MNFKGMDGIKNPRKGRAAKDVSEGKGAETR